MVGLFSFFQSAMVCGIITGIFNVNEASEKPTIDATLRRFVNHFKQMDAKIYWEKYLKGELLYQKRLTAMGKGGASA